MKTIITDWLFFILLAGCATLRNQTPESSPNWCERMPLVDLEAKILCLPLTVMEVTARTALNALTPNSSTPSDVEGGS